MATETTDTTELLDLVKGLAWAVMSATKKQGMSQAANKREAAALRRLLKAILGREPTDAEMDDCTPG